MRPELIEIDEAREVVLEHARALAGEPVELASAFGRVLAEDVRGAFPVPPFDNSAMDGFAVRTEDVRGASLERPVRLRLAGESRAGTPSAVDLPPGGAIEISTGAMLPAHAAAVVAREQAHRTDGLVEIQREVADGENVRRAGEDLRPGELVLGPGRLLGPAELGVLASLGRASARCVGLPRVGLITTGDELISPGQPLGPGQIYNSNTYALTALVRQLGLEAGFIESVPDGRAATRSTVARALECCEVLVLCGGVSVGEHDHVKEVLAELEVDQRFWGLALKPGKPTWFGTRGRQLVFGLPGNPVSTMVTFTLLVAPALRSLAGRRPPRRRAHAALAREYRKPPGRAHALRCRLRLGERGLEADSEGDTGSHMLTSMLDAQALALIPSAAERLAAGTRVELELLGWPALAP